MAQTPTILGWKAKFDQRAILKTIHPYPQNLIVQVS
jgi:hypothetical protein